MNAKTPSYHGYRFPPEIISHAVWLYYRFCLSFRDVEDLLAKRGVIVSHETIRQWSRKFGAEYARKLKRREGRLGDTWHLDELFVMIQGERQYLWRAVEQDGDVIDILVQSRRNDSVTVNPALDPQTSRAQRGSVLTSISMEVDSTAKYPLLRLKAGNSKRDLLSGVHAR
jgi:transposase-like protein